MGSVNAGLSGARLMILAGGQSRRMGRDKALLSLEGEPLLTRLSRIGLALALPTAVVTPWGDRYAPILPTQVTLIPEPLPTQGPVVGLWHGLRHWPQGAAGLGIVVLACDLPRLTVAEVRTWLDQFTRLPEGAIALLPGVDLTPEESWPREACPSREHAPERQVPIRRPRWHPLCGIYHPRCWPSLDRFVTGGGRSFQGWLAQQRVEPLQVSDRAILSRCNTPEEWAQVSQ